MEDLKIETRATPSGEPEALEHMRYALESMYRQGYERGFSDGNPRNPRDRTYDEDLAAQQQRSTFDALMTDFATLSTSPALRELIDAAQFALSECSAYAEEEMDDDSPNGEIMRRLRAALAPYT